MARLIQVPLGATARYEFCRRLEQLPFGRGVLVLPNRNLIEDVKAKSSVRCMSIDFLAGRLLNCNGYENFRALNRRSQEIILQEIIEYLEENGSLKYFSGLAGKTGFVRAAASLVSQLSRSGVTETEISKIIASWGRAGSLGLKDCDIAQIYSLYRTYLRNNNWFDLEGKYRLARAVLQRKEAVIPFDCVCFSDFYSFDRLQLDFIMELDKRCDVKIGLLYEKNRDEVFGAVRSLCADMEKFCSAETMDVSAGTGDLRQFAENFGRRCAPVPSDGSLRLRSFDTREAEMRGTLAEIKELLLEGVPASGIAAAVRSFAEYSGLRALADEYGIPVSLPVSTPLSGQPLAEFCRLLLAAAADSRDGAENYMKMLMSETGRFVFDVDGEAAVELKRRKYFTSRRELQQECGLLWPESCGALKLADAFLEQLPPSAAVKEYAELLGQLLADMQIEKRAGELYKKGEISLEGLGQALKALQSVRSCLQSLVKDYKECSKEKEKIQLSAWQQLLQEAFDCTEITLAPGRTDGVLFTEAVNLVGLKPDYVFLMGLREGEFPCGSSENWIYSDAERSELTSMGIDMPVAAQSYAEDMYFFAGAAASCGRELTISWHEDDDAGASPYIAQVQRLFTDLKVEKMLAAVPCSPEELERLGAAAGEKWLEERMGRAALEASGADSLRRKQCRFTGWLEDEELCRLVRRAAGSSFSASALEVYAACPFRYLAERIWQQQDMGAKDELPGPADEGSLLHKVLAVFMGKHLQEKLTGYPLPQLEQELGRCFAGVCEDFVSDGQISSNVFWQAEQQRLLKLLLLWLRSEYQEQQQWQGYLPCAVEWDFSSRGGRQLDLQLDCGSRVSIRGSIDRLDSSGSRVFVTYYKRSESSVPSAKALKDGLDLQLPVYLLAAGKLYGVQPSGASYYVLKTGRRKSAKVFEDAGNPGLGRAKAEETWEEFELFAENLLKDYIDGIYHGRFAVQLMKECSEYCPVRDICRVKESSAAAGGEDNG